MSIPYSRSLQHGTFQTWSVKPDMEFFHAKQIHGVDIVSTETLPCDADGLFVSWDDFKKPLAIKTADCMPIVIEGHKGVVFLHAGWRGLADGILKRAEIKMIEPERAFIGPCIHSCCFEVSKDFKNNFPGSPHFKEHELKFSFDLVAQAKDDLFKQFPNIKTEDALMCTACDHKFHSYRRNKTPDRNWNIYIKG